MLRSIRNELFGATKNRTRRSTNRSSRELRFEGLEAREMMAVGVVPAPALLAAANQHNGTGLASVSSAVTTKGVRAPAAPSFTAAAVSGSEVDLSWSTVSGATGYVIDELSSPGKWSQIGKVGSSTTEYAVTGLSSGATYTFRVVLPTRQALPGPIARASPPSRSTSRLPRPRRFRPPAGRPA